MKDHRYVLITPAHNEELYIEKIIDSVIHQTILPLMWVIVDDGSTDRTSEVVKSFQKESDFLMLFNKTTNHRRNFASKIEAFREGFRYLRNIDYDFIGNLDGDVSFKPNYYENIMRKFHEDERLGIAGGIVYDYYDGYFHRQSASLDSVAGAIQLFRRRCYEEIGGYVPLRAGGVDAVAEVMARMKGWRTQSFPEIKVKHYRRTWTKDRSVLRTRLDAGMHRYMLGYHIIFQLGKCVYEISEKPYIVGSLLAMCGYLGALLTRKERIVSDDLVKYLRNEQMGKLRATVSSKMMKLSRRWMDLF